MDHSLKDKNNLLKSKHASSRTPQKLKKHPKNKLEFDQSQDLLKTDTTQIHDYHITTPLSSDSEPLTSFTSTSVGADSTTSTKDSKNQSAINEGLEECDEHVLVESNLPVVLEEEKRPLSSSSGLVFRREDEMKTEVDKHKFYKYSDTFFRPKLGFNKNIDISSEDIELKHNHHRHHLNNHTRHHRKHASKIQSKYKTIPNSTITSLITSTKYLSNIQDIPSPLSFETLGLSNDNRQIYPNKLNVGPIGHSTPLNNEAMADMEMKSMNQIPKMESETESSVKILFDTSTVSPRLTVIKASDYQEFKSDHESRHEIVPARSRRLIRTKKLAKNLMKQGIMGIQDTIRSSSITGAFATASMRPRSGTILSQLTVLAKRKKALNKRHTPKPLYVQLNQYQKLPFLPLNDEDILMTLRRHSHDSHANKFDINNSNGIKQLNNTNKRRRYCKYRRNMKGSTSMMGDDFNEPDSKATSATNEESLSSSEDDSDLLSPGVWLERGRWIKFEENVDWDINHGSCRAKRWGEPHVPFLSFYSLLELRKHLSTGIVIFDLEVETFESMMEYIIKFMLHKDMINEYEIKYLRNMFLSPHKFALHHTFGHNFTSWLSSLDARNVSSINTHGAPLFNLGSKSKTTSATVPSGMAAQQYTGSIDKSVNKSINIDKDAVTSKNRIKSVKFKRASTTSNFSFYLRKRSSTFLTKLQGSTSSFIKTDKPKLLAKTVFPESHAHTSPDGISKDNLNSDTKGRTFAERREDIGHSTTYGGLYLSGTRLKRQSDPFVSFNSNYYNKKLAKRNVYKSILKKTHPNNGNTQKTKLFSTQEEPNDSKDSPLPVKNEVKITLVNTLAINEISPSSDSIRMIPKVSSTSTNLWFQSPSLLKRIPADAEGAAVLTLSLPASLFTGRRAKITSPHLSNYNKPLSIFVRLNKPITILPLNKRNLGSCNNSSEAEGDMGGQSTLPSTSILEVPSIPIRFFYILISPSTNGHKECPLLPSSSSNVASLCQDGSEYLYDLGRCFCTLMSNKFFQEVAYTAAHCRELVLGFNEFLNESIVLPISMLSSDAILPLARLYREKSLATAAMKDISHGDVASSHKESHRLTGHKDNNDAASTNTNVCCPIFKGLVRDIRTKLPWYVSDFKDFWSVRCIVTIIFIFLTTMPASITFGGLLGEITDNWIGVSEIMVADALAGSIFALFSGQPLLLVTVTGPLLVYEESLYAFTREYGIDYISFRVWVGFWVAVITIVAVAVDICVLIKYFTRFIEEIFALTIALVFIYEVGKKIHKLFYRHPLLSDYCHLKLTANKLDNRSLVAFEKNLMLTRSYIPLSQHYDHINGPSAAFNFSFLNEMNCDTNLTSAGAAKGARYKKSVESNFIADNRKNLNSTNSSLSIKPSSSMSPKLFYYGAGMELDKPYGHHNNISVVDSNLSLYSSNSNFSTPVPDFSNLLKKKLINMVGKLKMFHHNKPEKLRLNNVSTKTVGPRQKTYQKPTTQQHHAPNCMYYVETKDVNGSRVIKTFPFRLYTDKLRQFQNYYYEFGTHLKSLDHTKSNNRSNSTDFSHDLLSPRPSVSLTFFYTPVLPYHHINFSGLYREVNNAPDGALILDRDFRRCKILRPNTALLGTLLIFSTFLLAYFLRSIGTGVGLTNQSTQTKFKRDSLEKKASKYPKNVNADPYIVKEPQNAIKFIGVFNRLKSSSKLRNTNTIGASESIANYRDFISSLIPLSMRRILGDFGPPIALIVLCCIDALLIGNNVYLEKLNLHSSFTLRPGGIRRSIVSPPSTKLLSPTVPDKRGWFIHPLGIVGKDIHNRYANNFTRVNLKIIGLAILPAAMLFILLFIEGQLTALLINKKERKLKKGHGYNLDLLVIGLIQPLMGLFGLPWVSPAPIQSLAHVSCLSYYNTLECAPGEKPQVVWVREQRITGFTLSILTGLTLVLGSSLLQKIPIVTLFGIFLYLGVSALGGIQFFDRLKLFLTIPKMYKYVSDAVYIQKVKYSKIHLYTLIQLICLVILWAIKFTSFALFFPLLLLLIVPLRFQLKHIFSVQELHYLDMEEDEQLDEEYSCYTEAHIPV